MFTRLFSANIQGIEAQQISIEIDMSLGFLQWHISLDFLILLSKKAKRELVQQ